jgi:hypothetical protein
MSESEQGKIIHAMLPHPVYPFRGFITKITAVEIPAKEQVEAHLFAIGSPKLCHFDGLFLAPFIGIGEIPSRFGFNKNPPVSG